MARKQPQKERVLICDCNHRLENHEEEGPKEKGFCQNEFCDCQEFQEYESEFED